MYREPRSLAFAQRIVTWVYGTCCSIAARRVDPVADNLRLVALCARRLEVSEYDVFAKAYRAWYGCAPVVRELEREFYGFLTQRRDLPFYVRRFVNGIDTLAA